MDPIRVPRISNQVPRIRENYRRVPKIRENRVPTIRKIGSLQIHTGFLTFSLKKTLKLVLFWSGIWYAKLIFLKIIFKENFIYFKSVIWIQGRTQGRVLWLTPLEFNILQKLFSCAKEINYFCILLLVNLST